MKPNMKFFQKGKKNSPDTADPETEEVPAVEEAAFEKESRTDSQPDMDDGMEIGIADFNKVVEVDKRESASQPKTSQKRSKWWMLGFVLLAVVVGVVVALAVTLPKDDDGDSATSPPLAAKEASDTVSPTISPTATPLTATELAVLEIISPHTLEQTLLDPETPQGQAFVQLVSELPSASNIDDFRVQQRYALMSTFFAMGGAEWTNQDGWNGFTDNECEWYGITICVEREDGTMAVSGINLGKLLVTSIRSIRIMS